MRFLIDNAISPFVSNQLTQLGFDSVHVREYRLQAASDQEIFERAKLEKRIIVSADTDFAFLVVKQKTVFPSVILFRKGPIEILKIKSNF